VPIIGSDIGIGRYWEYRQTSDRPMFALPMPMFVDRRWSRFYFVHSTNESEFLNEPNIEYLV
jgi:hypothetical protein